MKYMMMMFGDAGTMMETKTPEWIREMIAFMDTFNDEITKSGELVAAEGLVDSTQAKSVRIQDGIPVATDGPFAETKESLIGFWIVDVASEERAIELTAKVVEFTREPIEVRRVADGPPEV